jgi:hypothetical protein
MKSEIVIAIIAMVLYMVGIYVIFSIAGFPIVEVKDHIITVHDKFIGKLCSQYGCDYFPAIIDTNGKEYEVYKDYDKLVINSTYNITTKEIGGGYGVILPVIIKVD